MERTLSIFEKKILVPSKNISPHCVSVSNLILEVCSIFRLLHGKLPRWPNILFRICSKNTYASCKCILHLQIVRIWEQTFAFRWLSYAFSTAANTIFPVVNFLVINYLFTEHTSRKILYFLNKHNAESTKIGYY